MKVSNWVPQPVLLNKTKAEKPKDAFDANFGEVLHKKLQEVNQLQLRSDELTQQLIAGGEVELHDVMLAAEQANLALQLTVQIRNKLVEAYQELSRMQI
ncbi:MAG: flagellar hook-basal body complex protein FliE [Zhaonellaceae bacterium]|jgi:flagellar hook-basal body complex protein FliE